MSALTSRRIFKSQTTGQAELRELLEMLFAAELLSPSRELWLVSAWVSNVEILNNEDGAYDSFMPDWGRRSLKLTETLCSLMLQGCSVTLVTNEAEHNKSIFEQLQSLACDWGVEQRLVLLRRETLHIKGILTDHFYLSGSMNLTFNGLTINDECIVLDTAASAIVQPRLEFEQYRETVDG
jgi:hypothetical protein